MKLRGRAWEEHCLQAGSLVHFLTPSHLPNFSVYPTITCQEIVSLTEG